jgi:hypothetical protein
VDIATYLRRTTPVVSAPDLGAEQPQLAWMTDSLSELDLSAPMEVVPVSTSDVSHKYVRLQGRHYLVWDVALNETLWRFLMGMQYARLAVGMSEHPNAEQFSEVATSLFRHTLFTYLGRKLTRFPHVAGAFNRLASEEPAAQQSPKMLERELMVELSNMQRLLMFYHEATHAILAERESLRTRSRESLTQLLSRLNTIAVDRALGADFDAAYPELANLNADERLTHFAEELNCDLQAFVFASMVLPNTPGIERRAWQDSIGLLFGASAMLASAERVLKLSVSKWTEFARESSDGQELTDRSVVLEQFVSDRPLAYLRRWNTMLAINAVLERLGKTRAEDAFQWQTYVVEKAQGLIEALDEYLVVELNALATPEFIAKVFARAKLSYDDVRRD